MSTLKPEKRHAIRRVTPDEIAMVRKMADEGPLVCECNGVPDICTCSLIIMICDELAAAAWQPIETAPKDATQLWGWSDEYGSVPMIWCADIDTWVITYSDQEFSPTRWMPFPEPPKP
jgi:hypothetical protein